MVGRHQDGGYPLNEEQKRIAEAPWNLPQLVLAPPGTGKTHTVVARVRYLIDTCHLHPRQEILVLCFTRAAVREILKRLAELVRLQQVTDDLRFATVRTFDSFASRLLAAADPERDISEKSFDERVKLLVDALQDPDSEESSRIREIRHLIVDEMQDLVGIRAALVQALLARIAGGFTLLGDPAQAIYGFSRRSPNDLDPNTLIAWLRHQSWMEPISECGLNVDYRTLPESHSTRVAHVVRDTLLTDAPQADAALKRLREIIAGLSSSGTGMTPVDGLSPGRSGRSVCVVCRNNGEVLQIASMLASKNIPVFLKPRAEDSALPPWIARVLGPFTRERISEREFLEFWAERVAAPQGLEGAAAWDMLRQVEGGDRRDLEVPLLHRRLRAGQRLPDDVDAYSDAIDGSVYLSTIHSVKGREFDQVAILGPEDDPSIKQEDKLEEARILYVAATRARVDLTRLDRGHLPRVWRTDDQAGGRWISHNHRGYYHVEAGLSRDFQVGSAVSEYQYPDPNEAMAIQNYIWDKVRPGDPIAVKRRFHRGFTFYNVFHGDPEQKVGGMSLAFVRDIRGALNSCGENGDRFPYPNVLVSLRVMAVVTEVLPFRASKIHHPFDRSGFALGVRFRGMGYLAKEY